MSPMHLAQLILDGSTSEIPGAPFALLSSYDPRGFMRMNQSNRDVWVPTPTGSAIFKQAGWQEQSCFSSGALLKMG